MSDRSSKALIVASGWSIELPRGIIMSPMDLYWGPSEARGVSWTTPILLMVENGQKSSLQQKWIFKFLVHIPQWLESSFQAIMQIALIAVISLDGCQIKLVLGWFVSFCSICLLSFRLSRISSDGCLDTIEQHTDEFIAIFFTSYIHIILVRQRTEAYVPFHHA